MFLSDPIYSLEYSPRKASVAGIRSLFSMELVPTSILSSCRVRLTLFSVFLVFLHFFIKKPILGGIYSSNNFSTSVQNVYPLKWANVIIKFINFWRKEGFFCKKKLYYFKISSTLIARILYSLRHHLPLNYKKAKIIVVHSGSVKRLIPLGHAKIVSE